MGKDLADRWSSVVTEESRRVEHVRTEREEDARLVVWGSFFKRERKSRGTKGGEVSIENWWGREEKGQPEEHIEGTTR